jgi:hypothetical protein
MADERNPATWTDVVYTFVDNVLPVIIGFMAGLLPWWYSRNDRKKKVKYELVELVYLFGNNLKNHLVGFNFTPLYSRRFEIEHEKYRNVIVALGNNAPNNATENVKAMLRDSIEFNKTLSNTFNEMQNVTTDKLIEIESKIMGLLSEIKEEYDVQLYKDISRLLRPMFANSNSRAYLLLYEFGQMTDALLTQAQIGLNIELSNKSDHIQTEVETLITELNTIMK